MTTSLSTYWVKFFTNAGFPHDVATKHAVVFSNNRIKPDMLPDLDKPSLKEMGITLMGDMIAILRYAKKVADEMTCERFLVDTVRDPPSPLSQKTIKPPLKRVSSKISNISLGTTTNKPSLTSSQVVRPVRAPASIMKSTVAMKKKPNVIVQASKIIPEESLPMKRKIVTNIQEISSESEEEWPTNVQKRVKVSPEDEKIGYKIIVPRVPTKIHEVVEKKKPLDQKRTVFDRLGDSSVTSTTNSTDSSTTFNVTGLGEVFKRNSSVFNRLGDKDGKKESAATGILKNGTSNGQPQGILKSRVSNIGTTVTIKTPSTIPKMNKTGTMHADYEKDKKAISTSVRQLVRTTKAIKLNSNTNTGKIVRKVTTNNKLVSERSGTLPAKSRLGVTGSQKQVTFNRVTTVKHIKKPGVFSRLGV